MHDITINDNNLYLEYDYLEELLKYSLEKLDIKNAIFSIIFVDDQEIKKINCEYRHKDQVTDVISFALEESDNLGYQDFRLLGDIYICIPQMIRQAQEYEHSQKRELSFLAIHGLLHLLGYNHETKEEEKEMFELQEMLLNDQDIKRKN